MKKLVSLAIAAIWLLPTAVSAAGEEGPVWFWFVSCGPAAMRINVTLDHRILHSELVPICRKSRKDGPTSAEQGKMSVTFEPKRRVAWYGYRATKEWSPSSEKLELGIWQAGADSQYMMLGVSVVGTKRIWMNTLIVADPYKATSGQIGGGLYVKIDPVRAE